MRLVVSNESSARMAKQAIRDTVPEMVIRKALSAAGLRYRVDYPLPGLPRRRADIVFTRQHLAVFVDGCFWHKCPEHATFPKTNAEWWRQKLQRNWDRDRETDIILTTNGWEVIRVWEHEDIGYAITGILEALARSKDQESSG